MATVLTKWANPINGKEREWRKKRGGLEELQRKGGVLKKEDTLGKEAQDLGDSRMKVESEK